MPARTKLRLVRPQTLWYIVKLQEIGNCPPDLLHHESGFFRDQSIFKSFLSLSFVSFISLHVTSQLFTNHECNDCKTNCKRNCEEVCCDETVCRHESVRRDAFGGFECRGEKGTGLYQQIQRLKLWISWLLFLREWERARHDGTGRKRARIDLVLGTSSAFCLQAKGYLETNGLHLKQDLVHVISLANERKFCRESEWTIPFIFIYY